MSWEEAVVADGDGCALLLEATPGARRSEFPAGFNPWRGRIGIKVRSPPVGGKANKEIVAAVALWFGVPEGAVAVVAGTSDSRKRVQVQGVALEVARARLREALDAS